MKLIILLILFVVSSFAVSFDCSKALKKDEKIICNNQELSQLDSKMSDLYNYVIKNTNLDIKKDIKTLQKEWLNKRTKCNNIACLKNLYNEQLLVLNTYNKANSSNNETYSLLENPQIYDMVNKIDSFLKKYGIELKHNLIFITISIILVLLLIIVLVIIFKIKKFIQLQKMKKGLEQTYKQNSKDIGIFLNNDMYLNSHLKIIDPKLKDNTDIQLKLIKIYIPISKCLINAEAKWTADVGEVDNVAYQQALNAHNIARAKHDAENFRSNSSRIQTYQGREPLLGSFTRYTFKNGEVNITINNSWTILNNIKLDIDNSDSIISEKIENTIINVYKNLFKIFINLDKPEENSNNIIIDKDKSFTLKKLEKNIESKIMSKVKSNIGSYHKNLDIINLDRNLEFKDLVYLPLAIVVSNKNGGNRITIHDHLDPNTIIS